jgi:hypothetical protein
LRTGAGEHRSGSDAFLTLAHTFALVKSAPVFFFGFFLVWLVRVVSINLGQG